MADGPVSIFVTQLEPGGAQSAALKLTLGLVRKQADARLYFLYRKKAIENPPMEFLVVSQLTPRNVLFLPDLVLRLFVLFYRIKPTAVISFTHYANVVVQPIATLMGVRTRIASQRNVSGSYPRIARMLDLIWGTAGIYTHNVMVSQSVLRSFQSRPGPYLRRTCVIPNGYERPAKASTQVDVGSLTKQAGRSRKVVISIGRLAPQKHHAVLIQILPMAPGVHVLIVGDGELREPLRRLAEGLGVRDRVSFVSEFPNQHVIQLISQADVFALPSRHEGMSNALIEALFSNTPIVASDIPENREVLNMGGGRYAGLLASPDNQDEWFEKIGLLLDDPILAKSLVAAANERSKAFGLDRMVDGFERLMS